MFDLMEEDYPVIVENVDCSNSSGEGREVDFEPAGRSPISLDMFSVEEVVC